VFLKMGREKFIYFSPVFIKVIVLQKEVMPTKLVLSAGNAQPVQRVI